MSSALLRQALDFVDDEGFGADKKSKSSSRRRVAGQERRPVRTSKVKKRKEISKSAEQRAEENVKKLLALSEPVADCELTAKIVKRAVKGKPLTDFIEVPQNEPEKSILFPEEESFKTFEEEPFCS